MTPRPARPDGGDRAGRGSVNPPPPIAEPPAAPVQIGWQMRDLTDAQVCMLLCVCLAVLLGLWLVMGYTVGVEW